ncbi:cytochrome P450 [Qaidamihabitans albus]|uniref:cytochrome P450 n=1 Tax=Qaidamihabitans albus TaxID=2795733 RepID=UPI0018F1E2A5|nr:cytochrome P450 [Qaidamihabitans albus]
MSPARRSSLPRFDSHDPAVLDDPYAVYARLREYGPVCRGGTGQWVLTRHEDVAAFLADPRLSSEYPPEYHRLSVGDGPAVSFFSRILLDRDPPAHTRLRKAMHRAFRPAAVRALTDRIGALVDDFLVPALDRGSLDVVEELAFPLPVSVVCELIGIPAADRALIRPHAVDLARGFGLVVADDDRAATHVAVTWLREYVGALAADRRRSPGDDVLSHLLEPDADGIRLDLDEVVDNVVFLFFAGFETTMNLLANGVAALLDTPDELRRLRADPALVPSAVEEFLRFDAPIQAAARLVREPMTVHGHAIRSGRLLVLLLGSANRDERAFADPDRLDVARRPNPHVSFGGGAHLCLGAALARMEGRIAFDRLARRFRDIEPAGERQRRHSTSFRSLSRLPVTVRAT